MINVAELITFAVYFIALMGVGWYFYKKTVRIEDYLLGGRKMGRWVTALSAQASDMSGWLLMGLPGAVFLMGVNQSWIAIGLFIGTVVNWLLIAPRLRVFTGETESLTISSFFESRFQDPTGLLRIVSAIIILLFFTIYASSGLVGAGKLFESMFSIDYRVAVFLGGLVIILYTFMGGFLAVCWTDLFQGSLMFIAIILVPTVAFFSNGGMEGISTAMAAKEISTSIIPGGKFPLVMILSTAAWGLGYFGQPHILSRFMSIKSVKELPRSATIAIIWVLFSLGFAVIVGLVAIPMFPEITGGDSEKVFIYMVRALFNPWMGGILLAAILSAIMSTIDSQLLVSSSALTEDFYKKVIKKDAGEKELILIGRISVLIISLIAMLLALNPSNSILGLVSYAWGGFGAAFGPVIIAALFSEKTNWKSALAGMITGTLVLIVWERLGYGAVMYEIVPGFVANSLVIWLLNHFTKPEDQGFYKKLMEAFHRETA
jgi:sodium/proline symporter